jgi:hypothetical protein
MLRWVALSLGLLAWSVPALACVPPVERAVYRIEHETFGDIGRQVLTFWCDRDRLVVDTTVDVAVRMLFLTIYRHEARYRGVWQGDRLIRFESHTDDNGKILEVFARAAGERVIIDGPKGQSQAPLNVVPNHPWNLEMIDSTVLFDPVDGRVLQVDVTNAGEEPIDADGHRIMARKYLVSSDVQLKLWYDESGMWVKSRMEHEQGAVTIIRELPHRMADAGLG